jgi:hypothetical protein
MKISAFTLISNAVKFDYPIIESINSLLPYVDEYIVNIGKCDDGTFELLKKEFGGNRKIIMFVSKWEDKSSGTLFFSNQTNKALELCSGDWAFYLQADECFHGEDASKLRLAISLAEENDKSAITFKYFHFEGSPWSIRKDYNDGFDAYDKEIRLIRNDGSLVSWGDAQSFCLQTDPNQPAMHHKEILLDSDMHIYHYGYLKSPEKMLNKKLYLDEFYKVDHPDRKENIVGENGKYVFSSNVKSFKGTHPSAMAARISCWNQ